MSTTTFTLPPDAGIRSIGALADDLLDALASGHPVRVDLSAVEYPDLAVVQLIAAARRDAARAGTAFTLAAAPAPALAALLDRAGFLTGEPDDTTFWLHGDMPR